MKPELWQECMARAAETLAGMSPEARADAVRALTDEMKARPFGEYADFADCVAQNSDKGDPEAYCAVIKRQIEGDSAPEAQRTAKESRRPRAYPFGMAVVETKLEMRADGAALPKGICGRVTGVLLPYNRVDSYGTRFARGCMDRSRAEKVPAGRVPLFINMTYDGSGMHMYNARTHVGVVRTLEDVGDNAVMGADIFDTPDGRAAKDYLEKVLGAGASTGLSVGFRERKAPDLTKETVDGENTYVATYTEIELMEGTITPLAAVPGAEVMAVRSQLDLAAFMRGLWHRLAPEDREAFLTDVRTQDDHGGKPPASGPTPEKPASPPASMAEDAAATMDERVAAFRSTFDTGVRK